MLHAIVLAALFTFIASGQSWREIPLPTGTKLITFAGNPTREGMLALWAQFTPIVDSARTRIVTPARFYISTNSGERWTQVDTSVFSLIDTPLLRYSDSPFAVHMLADAIVRITFAQEGLDQSAFFIEQRTQNFPFIKRAYPHPNSLNEGTPHVQLAASGALYNLYVRLDQDDDSTACGIYKTTDGGTSWRLTCDSAAGMYVTSRAVCFALRPFYATAMFLGTIRGMYATFSEGNAWQRYETSTDLDEMVVRFIHPHLGNDNVIYACGYRMNGDTRDALFRTSNRGSTWQRIFTDTLIRGIATTDADARVAMINTFSGVHASTDFGIHWRRIDASLPPVPFGSTIQSIHIDPVNPSRAYIATPTKLFVTDQLLDVHRVPSAPVFSFDVFPRPFYRDRDAALRIRLSSVNRGSLAVIVTDVLGRERLVKSMLAEDEESFDVFLTRNELAPMPPGSYFISVRTASQTKSAGLILR